jgi:hypothetical protein
MENQTENSFSARVEHRRSKRFLVVVAAEVRWRGPNGVRIKEKANAEEVNAHGGLLRMETYPSVGDIIELTNLISSESVEARVVAMRGSSGDALRGIVIELFVPSETFWGMNFQLMKTTAGLLRLEQDLRPDGIDLRLLREFRIVADDIRRSAWTIEKSELFPPQRQNPQGTLSLLTTERLRCATQLCNELIVELESRDVTIKTEGIAEFRRSVDRAYQFLERFVMPYENDGREKRLFPRVEQSKGVWVAWQGGGQRFVSRVFDLSGGGVFVPTSVLPPVGSVVKLIFETSDGDIHARAIVRHTIVGRGMGLEFAAMDEDDLAHILQLLHELV